MTQSIIESVFRTAGANDCRDARADQEGRFPAYQVDHLVIEFDAKDLATCGILDRVLIARAQVVVAADDCELWKEVQREEVAVPPLEYLFD